MQVPRLKALIAKYKASSALEVQQRSCEYARIFVHEALRPQLLERMPAMEDAEDMLKEENGTAAAGGHILLQMGVWQFDRHGVLFVCVSVFTSRCGRSCWSAYLLRRMQRTC